MHTKQIVENILALFIINQEITVYKLTMEEVHCTDYLLQKWDLSTSKFLQTEKFI